MLLVYLSIFLFFLFPFLDLSSHLHPAAASLSLSLFLSFFLSLSCAAAVLLLCCSVAVCVQDDILIEPLERRGLCCAATKLDDGLDDWMTAAALPSQSVASERTNERTNAERVQAG